MKALGTDVSPTFVRIRAHSIITKSSVLILRGLLDNNAKLKEFADKLEAACIAVVESGKMTKDLAILSHGPK